MPKHVVSFFLLAHLTLAAAAVSAESPARTPTNVLIFLADDLGQRDIVAYSKGNFYETPNVDRLATQGALFTDAYTANPVCSPTRYAIMTGKWPTRARLTNWLPGNRTERFKGAEIVRNMDLAEVTLAEALKPRGYVAAMVGKWHLGEDETHWPEAQGFDVNIGGNSMGRPNSWFSPYKNPRLKDGPAGEFLTARLAEETVAQLRKFKSEGKPFLLCHHFYQVHTPLKAPPELIRKYEAKAKRLGLEAQFADETQYFINAKEPRRVRVNQTLPVFAAMVESMDTAVGRVLAALEELGMADSTLVIFTSDNGGLSTAEGSPTSNLPFRGGKGWIYEGGIRAPLLVRWPGVVRPGTTSSVPVTSLDIYPTVLAAAGASAQHGQKLDGMNLVPVLQGDKGPDRDLFWHYPHYSNQGGFPGGAIRSGHWKLVENYEDGSIALYDLSSDLGERTDLSKVESKRAAALLAKLHAWYRTTDAQFLRQKEGGPTPWRPAAAE